jgi:hypothetical protein
LRQEGSTVVGTSIDIYRNFVLRLPSVKLLQGLLLALLVQGFQGLVIHGPTEANSLKLITFSVPSA